MRKAFVWAALAAVVVTADGASAQIEWGAVAGLSLANQSGDDADGFDSRTGFFAGAQLVWQRPGSLIGFETGAVYIQKGAEASEDGVDGALELTYIDVPIGTRPVTRWPQSFTTFLVPSAALRSVTSCSHG